jgi:hypothetical protein
MQVLVILMSWDEWCIMLVVEMHMNIIIYNFVYIMAWYILCIVVFLLNKIMGVFTININRCACVAS